MKTIPLTALIFLFVMIGLHADPPESGQSLGTITTTDGKSYADAKLAVVEPEGISILYADGGAKIAFTSLSPEMQKEFGYDPDKSAFYAREQQYLAQIDRLQQENAQLRRRLNIAVDQQDAQVATTNAPHPTIAGYHYFLGQGLNASGPFKQYGQGSNVKVRYSQGPFQGMTRGEAELAAQQQWSGLSHDQQMTYEQDAKLYGDPIAKQDELDRISAAHPHPSGATVQGSDGTTYNVQYH